MEPEIVEKLKARIVAAEVSLLPPSIQWGAEFLIRARNDREGWGAYAGMPIDLVSSAAAVEALESCEHAEFDAPIRTSRLSLREYVLENSDNLNLAELISSLRILSRADRNAELCQLTERLIGQIRKLRNGQAWGNPIVAIRTTADVVLALLPYRDLASDLIDPAIQLLADEQNQDGGWPVTVGGSSSAPLPSAKAITALALAQPEQDGNDFRDASRYLQGLLRVEWKQMVAESGDLQAAAQVLRATAVLRSFPFEIVSKGVEYILDQRNEDKAWGERKGGNSNVEATSCCITALCAAGANRLINSKFALAAINEAGAALRETRRELDQIRTDVRNQVTRGTGKIVAENDRLNAKVIELEREKKILVGKVEETERRVQDLLETVSDKQDVSKGRESLLRYFNLFSYLYSRVSVLWVWPTFLIGLTVVAFIFRLGFAALITASFTFGSIGVMLAWFVVEWLSIEPKLGSIGTSDRKLVQRRLNKFIAGWSAGTRESFLHRLSSLPDSDPEARESFARSIARSFPYKGSEADELSVLLTLFAGLSADEQKEILYSLREVPGRVAVS